MVELQVYLDANGYTEGHVPYPPPGASDVWEWSLAMEKARSGYGHGCVPFSWSDFHAFFEEWGVRPRQWQIAALRAMETIWLKHWNDKTEKPAEEPKMGRQFSVELFDAWFD